RMELAAVAIKQQAWAEAEDLLDVALDDCRATGDVRTEALCLGNRAVARRKRGRFAEAVDDARAAVERVAPLGMPRREALARVMLSEALDHAGAPDEARAEAERALVLAEHHGDRKLIGEVLLVIGEATHDPARFRRAVEQFRAVDRLRLVEALVRLAEIEPDDEAARAAYVEARALVGTIEPPPIVREILAALAERW
ncbi:MAG: hypothetical protein ABMB14_09870, partial [Myxococcota bacterium]